MHPQQSAHLGWYQCYIRTNRTSPVTLAREIADTGNRFWNLWERFKKAWLPVPHPCLGATQTDWGNPGQPLINLQISSENDPFLKWIMTSDWKWITNSNVVCMSSWATVRVPLNAIYVGLHLKKIFLSGMPGFAVPYFMSCFHKEEQSIWMFTPHN